MSSKEIIEKISNCIKEIKLIINNRAVLVSNLSLNDVLKDAVDPGDIDWNRYIKTPNTEEDSARASKSRPGYELVDKGKVKVYKKIKNHNDGNKKQTTSKNRVKRSGKPKKDGDFIVANSQVSGEKDEKSEVNQIDTKQESQIIEIAENAGNIDQSYEEVDKEKNTLTYDKIKIESINTANNDIKNQRKIKEKENLVNALLNIKESNIYVKCLVKRKIIQDQISGITYYSEQLDQFYQIYASDKSDIQAKNNLLILLYKIGDFINTFDCYASFNKALSKFDSRNMYKRLSKISKVVYSIWNPNTEFDLLKISEFSLYWFDNLNQSDIEEVRESIHYI
jgi:hypothetical protein